MSRRWLVAGFPAVLAVALLSTDWRPPHASGAVAEALPGEIVKYTDGDSVIGVFEGRTPCGEMANAFTGFPSQNCEKIKWRLTLFRHPSTGQPTAYLYEGTRTTKRGALRSEQRVTAAWSGLVYHLDFPPQRVLSFLTVNDRVLVLLDSDLRALPGDASWSYVLNRVPVAPEDEPGPPSDLVN